LLNHLPGLFISLTNQVPGTGHSSMGSKVPGTFLESPHQSPYVVMTPHHINLYPMVKEKNECNYVEIHPYEENARGAE
jgi:hypothetical protein